MHSRHEPQQLGCSHCGRVYQWSTWTIRCIGCEIWVAEGCEDCGKEAGAWSRYNEHIHKVHGDFMGNFQILEEVVPELLKMNGEQKARIWRNWLNAKPQDDVRMLVLRPLTPEHRLLIQRRFQSDWAKGMLSP